MGSFVNGYPLTTTTDGASVVTKKFVPVSGVLDTATFAMIRFDLYATYLATNAVVEPAAQLGNDGFTWDEVATFGSAITTTGWHHGFWSNAEAEFRYIQVGVNVYNTTGGSSLPVILSMVLALKQFGAILES